MVEHIKIVKGWTVDRAEDRPSAMQKIRIFLLSACAKVTEPHPPKHASGNLWQHRNASQRSHKPSQILYKDHRHLDIHYDFTSSAWHSSA